jgi:hypothetical protein
LDGLFFLFEGVDGGVDGFDLFIVDGLVWFLDLERD